MQYMMGSLWRTFAYPTNYFNNWKFSAIYRSLSLLFSLFLILLCHYFLVYTSCSRSIWPPPILNEESYLKLFWWLNSSDIFRRITLQWNMTCCSPTWGGYQITLFQWALITDSTSIGSYWHLTFYFLSPYKYLQISPLAEFLLYLLQLME